MFRQCARPGLFGVMLVPVGGPPEPDK